MLRACSTTYIRAQLGCIVRAGARQRSGRQLLRELRPGPAAAIPGHPHLQAPHAPAERAAHSAGPSFHALVRNSNGSSCDRSSVHRSPGGPHRVTRMPSSWHGAALTPSEKLLPGPPPAQLCFKSHLRAVPLPDIHTNHHAQMCNSVLMTAQRTACHVPTGQQFCLHSLSLGATPSTIYSLGVL